jgi:hypothetical protein
MLLWLTKHGKEEKVPLIFGMQSQHYSGSLPQFACIFLTLIISLLIVDNPIPAKRIKLLFRQNHNS